MFENNRANHGSKTLTDPNKDDTIGKCGVLIFLLLNLFLPNGNW